MSYTVDNTGILLQHKADSWTWTSTLIYIIELRYNILPLLEPQDFRSAARDVFPGETNVRLGG